MVGRFNSSVVRVWPIFSYLLNQGPTGRRWIGRLLGLGARSAVLPPELFDAPGELLSASIAPRRHVDQRPRCFEYSVPPPAALLIWLLEQARENPLPKGVRPETNPDTRHWRGLLRSVRRSDRDRAVDHGLRLVDEHWPPHGRPWPWWALEGPTSVDCRLETSKCVVYVEGKYTEPVSRGTTWMTARNQLVRNLDVIDTEAVGKWRFVVLIGPEGMTTDIDLDELSRSAPHRSAAELQAMRSRWVGLIPWTAVQSELDIPPRYLPNDSVDARDLVEPLWTRLARTTSRSDRASGLRPRRNPSDN